MGVVCHNHIHKKSFWQPKFNLWTTQAEIWHMDIKKWVRMMEHVGVFCYSHNHRILF